VRGTALSTALAAPRKPVSGHRSADRVRDFAKGISGGASASVKRCGRRSASRPQLPGARPDLSEPRALRGRADGAGDLPPRRQPRKGHQQVQDDPAHRAPAAAQAALEEYGGRLREMGAR